MINSKIIHEIQPDFMQEYYKGYTLQIDYDYLKKCYRDIDKIYFRQPDDYINKIILEKILEIIRFYNTDSHDDDIRINSYIKMLVFLLLENLSCKKRNVIETKHKNMIVEIRAFLRQDGSVDQVDILYQARYNSDPHFRSIADSARRAVYICAPYKIFAEKYYDNYDMWKTMLLRFNPLDATIE